MRKLYGQIVENFREGGWFDEYIYVIRDNLLYRWYGTEYFPIPTPRMRFIDKHQGKEVIVRCPRRERTSRVFKQNYELPAGKGVFVSVPGDVLCPKQFTTGEIIRINCCRMVAYYEVVFVSECVDLRCLNTYSSITLDIPANTKVHLV